MNFFKTLALVGLVGVGMVYAESADTNKIVEIRTQILSFPRDTVISDKSLQDTFRQSADVPSEAVIGVAALLPEQTQSLLVDLKKQPNVDRTELPSTKVHSGESATTSNVVECKIPDTDQTKIGTTITATPVIQKDNYTIDLTMKIDWNRYLGYYSKNTDGKWVFNLKNPGAIAVIPSSKPTSPLIHHTITDLSVDMADSQTLVFRVGTLNELKTTSGDQITLLLVTANIKIDESQIRKELSEKLEKAISSKDEAAFEECFGYSALSPAAQNSVKQLEKKVFGWDRAYVEIVDPLLFSQLNPKDSSSGNTILTLEKGTAEMNGKYLFDIHISKEKSAKNGFIMIGGGLSKDKPIVLSNIAPSKVP
jgi:hypothetical protein